VRVTVGIGFSWYPQHGEDVDALLWAADSAMYRAKKEGGDRHPTGLPSGLGAGGVLEGE
jgi:GGDEF domain-containing protein